MRIKIFLQNSLFASFLLCCFLALTVNQSSAASAYPSCTKNNDVIQINLDRCFTSAQEYRMTVYEIGLCKSNISFTETSVNSIFDELVAANCEVVYVSSENGTPIILTGNSGGSLQGGSATLPMPGIFSYAYVKISNILTVSGTWTFNNYVIDSAGSQSVLPSKTCWTISTPEPFASSTAVNYYNRGSATSYPSPNTAPLITECGSNPSPSPLSIAYDTFDGGYGGEENRQLYLPLDNYPFLDGNANIKVALIDADGKLSKTPNYMLYFTNIVSGPLAIDENTNYLTLEINNSLGALVNFYSINSNPDSTDPSYLNFISPGSFLLKVSKN